MIVLYEYPQGHYGVRLAHGDPYLIENTGARLGWYETEEAARESADSAARERKATR
ncbi:MAG: hypothetical protein ACR2JW_17010 [Thermomicrobiales bacterium]